MCSNNGQLTKYQLALDKIRVQFERDITKRVDAFILAGHEIEAQDVFRMVNPDWTHEQCREAVEERALYISVRALKMAGDAASRMFKKQKAVI